ncbi:MAG: SGNH/GDSL hydrolase family protein [Nitrospirota bacterium]
MADAVLSSALFLFEISFALMVLTAHGISLKPSFVSFLQSRPGYLFAVTVLGMVASGVTIIYRYYQDDGARRRVFKLTVSMNIVTVLILATVGEGTIRALYKETPTGDVLSDRYLYPREWGKVVAYYKETFRSHLGEAPFSIYDNLLGWTIGSSRRRDDGPHSYFSSAEGLRSREVGTVLADRQATTRVALVGDSYTFAEEVSFDESWGRQLELRLGKNYQVLNFGVMGYSIAQAYLRYIKEVRPWHPDVVIFGMIDDNLRRAMGVYSFLTFPEGSSAFAVPRFAVVDEQLTLVNTPLPHPEQIFSARSINDLPYITYDRSYIPFEWDRPYWTFSARSYLFRWLESWFPQYMTLGPEVSDVAMKAISLEIFRAFTEKVRADGSIPILVYFPGWSEEEYQAGYKALAPQILRTAGLEYIDLTECLSKVPFAERLMPLHHYSSKGNEAVASCLHEVVTEQLRKGRG